MAKCYDCRTTSDYLIDEATLKPFTEFAGRAVDYCHDGKLIYQYINDFYTVMGLFENNIPKLICDGDDNCLKYVDETEIAKERWNDHFQIYCKECIETMRIACEIEGLQESIISLVNETEDIDLLRRIANILKN